MSQLKEKVPKQGGQGREGGKKDRIFGEAAKTDSLSPDATLLQLPWLGNAESCY